MVGFGRVRQRGGALEGPELLVVGWKPLMTFKGKKGNYV